MSTGLQPLTEPPISTPNCPRLYGIFAHPTNCRIFYSCWNGEGSKYECPPGLAYDNQQRFCVWADLVERCDQLEVAEGFVCPDPAEVEQPGTTRATRIPPTAASFTCASRASRALTAAASATFSTSKPFNATIPRTSPDARSTTETLTPRQPESSPRSLTTNLFRDLEAENLCQQQKKRRKNVFSLSLSLSLHPS